MCICAPGWASSYTVFGPAGIDLPQLALSTAEDADLRILPTRLEAKFGIRLEDSGQQYANTAPVIIGRPFIVRDARGKEYRFWVHAISGASRMIEVAAVDSSGGNRHPTQVEAVFRVSAFRVGGAPAQYASRELQLFPDGAYRLGGVTGRWKGDERAIALEGNYSAWGKGELSRDGAVLTFRYERGGLPFELVMNRAR